MNDINEWFLPCTVKNCKMVGKAVTSDLNTLSEFCEFHSANNEEYTDGRGDTLPEKLHPQTRDDATEDELWQMRTAIKAANREKGNFDWPLKLD